MRILLSSVLATALLANCLQAQSFTYQDFSSTTGLALNGTAAQSGTVLALTTNQTGQAGSAYYATPVAISAGFDTTFSFQLINPVVQFANGADGMTFCVQNDPRGTTALGSTGGAMGYAGNPGVAIANSLVVEFDTWQNNWPSGQNDLSNSEISIHTNGMGDNGQDEMFRIASVIPQANLLDGQLHVARVEYVGGILNVYLDNLAVPEITVPWDFVAGGVWAAGGSVSGLSLINGTDAYVGFTASTGGDAQDHQVLAWSFTSTSPLGPCYSSNLTSGEDVLTVNGGNGGFSRTVSAFTGDPITIAVAQPSTITMPAPFIVFGAFGFPTPQDAYPTAFGTFCFPPALALPVPGLFTLADSFSANPNVLVPFATPAPWSYTLASGVPFPVQVSLQAIVQQSAGPTNLLATSNAVLLDVVNRPPPVIASVVPVNPAPGTTVTVMGSDFVSGLTIDVGGTPVAASGVTATSASFVMPSGIPCDSTLTLTNPDGQAAATPFNPSPVITNTVFPTGPAAGGATFVIVGMNLQGSTVTIGGAAATIINATSNAITMMTPPGSVGPANVIVTAPNGCTVSTTYAYQ